MESNKHEVRPAYNGARHPLFGTQGDDEHDDRNDHGDQVHDPDGHDGHGHHDHNHVEHADGVEDDEQDPGHSGHVMEVDDNDQRADKQLKACPFCAGRAELVIAHDPVRYGVRCVACRVYFLPNLETREEALARWNRRVAGTAGGRATKGLTSRRKRRAARRNLRTARKQKQLQRIRAEVDKLMTQLKSARQVEMAEIKAMVEQSRAKLAAMEPRIQADPILREMRALVRNANASH
jgi:hypothetical protein